jgi:hypothetical protein
MISVLGVPGYPAANLAPHSKAPRAIASFPDISSFTKHPFPDLHAAFGEPRERRLHQPNMEIFLFR